ncbi:ABC transporter ATP-binding protein [uncultured Brevibacillus sp.]|uniref:ABC transporter ATP-binding protein n=1 Tax=uncultured Brevibacillus sp. TaxID=169970 RepID=UPI002595F49A|nr:ABC transporter ATP-binding protein [uncultured Brevibacillus sp.]
MKQPIEFHQVSKKLGRRSILEHINLSVHAGEVVGIVGTNGSGKTTLLRLVTGLVYPDHGEVFVGGNKISPGLLGVLPTSVGAVIESPSFLPQYSGLKNLSLLADIRGKISLDTVKSTMKKLDLDPSNKKAVQTYSLGMRQRLAIAQAIMENPDILLFDEPTNGLDEHGVHIFSTIMQEQVQRGSAIMIVSHHKDEITRYCDRVFGLEERTLKQKF